MSMAQRLSWKFLASPASLRITQDTLRKARELAMLPQWLRSPANRRLSCSSSCLPCLTISAPSTSPCRPLPCAASRKRSQLRSLRDGQMMSDHEPFLPTSPDDAIMNLRSAAAALADADRARAYAAGRVREAVMAARVMKVSWESIGKELGVSRQAATERYGGELRAQLVVAWHSIEILLAQIAADRGHPDRPVDVLRKLGEDGAV